jgi:hypothetical protein
MAKWQCMLIKNEEVFSSYVICMNMYHGFMVNNYDMMVRLLHSTSHATGKPITIELANIYL